MPDTAPNLNASPRRLKSLDVLRGVAILLMIFSGLLPKTLPNWMDHGYQPHFRPDAQGVWTAVAVQFDPRWKAYTWVDLVFPLFLFCMGAAIPLVLNPLRLRVGGWSTLWHVVKRWGTLVLFALLLNHLGETFLKSSDPNTTRLVVIAAFLLAFLFFVRWPAGTPHTAQVLIRAMAFIGMAALIGAYGVRNQIGVSWTRADIIILVIAFSYLTASAIWLISSHHPSVRLIILIPIILLAHYVQFDPNRFGDWLWVGTQPFDKVHPIVNALERMLNLPAWIPWLRGTGNWSLFIAPIFDLSAVVDITWLKFLWIVIPGTIVGDWLHGWMNRKTIESVTFESERSERKVSRLLIPATLLVCVAVFAGLRHYGFGLFGIGGPLKTPWLSLILTIPALVYLGRLVLPHAYGSLWIARRLFYFGATFLLIGLFLACLPYPGAKEGFFEGGISKGPPATLSYYLVSVGLSTLLLMSLACAFDYKHNYAWPGNALEANGQNPLLAYYIAHTVLAAILGLSLFGLFGYPFGRDIASLDQYFTQHLLRNPWLLACWAAAKTMAIAMVVWIFSAKHIFWRA